MQCLEKLGMSNQVLERDRFSLLCFYVFYQLLKFIVADVSGADLSRNQWQQSWPTQTTRLMSFNRTQSRVVSGLLTGHNTLRRHLHLMGLINSPLRRRCGAEGGTSAYTLCECEALASLRHVQLGSFILDPGDVKSLSLGAVWNFSKGTGLPDYGT